MKKTGVFFAGIMLIILLVYACDMPSSIEFKTDKFEINAPVKIARFDLASLLSEALKDSFPEGFKIYDMVNYPSAQAFLIAYELDLMESFDPDEYLDMLKNPEGIEPISESITIPKMTMGNVSDTWFYFEMQDFFDDMQAAINTSSPPSAISASFSHPDNTPSVTISNMGDFANMPALTVIDGNNSAPDFDSIFVHEGRIVLDIWLEFDSTPDSNLTVELTGIDLKEASSPYNRIGSHTAPITATLTSSHTEANKYPVVININGEEIKKGNPPKFQLGGITSKYTGGGPAGNVVYTLYIQPQIQGITPSGARNLKIDETKISLPTAISDGITMAPVTGLFNAEIARGELRIEANPPAFSEDSGNTGCTGMTIGYELAIQQDPVVVDSTSFLGLNETFTGSTGASSSLAGKKISGGSLSVKSSDSNIVIKTGSGGITFNLSDTWNDDSGLPQRKPFTEKVLPIKLNMDMDINELTVVRWNKNILPSIDIPEIVFANMGGQNGSLVNKIEFNKIKLNINFAGQGLPEALEKRIALKINCSEFGFDDITQILRNGDNFFTGGNGTLDIGNSDVEVKFDVSLIPVIGGSPKETSPYIEIGPVIMGDTDITMNIYAQVSVDEFDWESVEINIKAALGELDDIQGTFPEEEGIDLSGFKNYMNGITFSENLSAKIFLSGPDKIINQIEPKVKFNAQWGSVSPPDGVSMIDGALVVGKELPELPPKNSLGEWVYSGTALPSGGLEVTGFNDIISQFPQNLRFNYEMTLKDDPITVNREDFNDVNKIRAMMVLLLPLELNVAPNGFVKIPALFESEKDLFGRKDAGEASPFTGINIKSLGIKIDFGYPVFTGAYLHLDKEKKLFAQTGLPLTGNSWNIIFTGEQKRIIDENLIIPLVMFEFHDEGGTMRIGRNPSPVRIVITASGNYTLDPNDLFGPGN